MNPLAQTCSRRDNVFSLSFCHSGFRHTLLVAMLLALTAMPFDSRADFVERSKNWVMEIGKVRFGVIEYKYFNMGDGRLIDVGTVFVAGDMNLSVPVRTGWLCITLLFCVGLCAGFWVRGKSSNPKEESP